MSLRSQSPRKLGAQIDLTKNALKGKMSTIYIDMDNVVADFEAHYLAITGTSWDSEEDAMNRWRKLAGKEKYFFSAMPAIFESEKFVSEIQQLGEGAGYRCKFLTAVPSLWKFPAAEEEKTQWIIEKLNSELPVVIGPFARDKVNHCKPGDILIDDSDLNIQQWRGAGGFGILHVSFAHSLSDLRKILDLDGE
jgi:5'(3')-deoxyribonucleotidase